MRSGTNVIYELSRASTGESYGTFVFLKDLMVLFLIIIIIVILLYFFVKANWICRTVNRIQTQLNIYIYKKMLFITPKPHCYNFKRSFYCATLFSVVDIQCQC